MCSSNAITTRALSLMSSMTLGSVARRSSKKISMNSSSFLSINMESMLIDRKLEEFIDIFLDDLRATDPKVILDIKDNALVVIALELHIIRRILTLKFPVV